MTQIGPRVDTYIQACPETTVGLMNELRDFVHAALPGAREGLQYGVPVFHNAYGVPVVYLYCAKAGHVNFGFLRAAELSDPDDVLEGSGAPSKHIKVFPGRAYDAALLRGFLDQCADLGG